MANVYQQAAKRRKVGYLAAMLGLLVLSLVVRGTFFRIGAASAEEISADRVRSLTLDGRAKVHELTELQQGDKELGGAAVQLLLTGSRGLAVCGLWLGAIDKQRQQEWSELDIAVDSITKLQPHFTAPWLFQSWNLTYNVSVEMDRLNDMYFYIARGISVLAEGEAVNRNNPDLRYNLGFYYQNKFGVSDRVTTLRCLYQLSCIPEEDRNPDLLLNPDKTINLDRFEQFCRDHRELARRMKETRIQDGSEDRAQPLATTPAQVISFLRNNRKVPSRYKPGTHDLEKDRRLKQFPVLPDLHEYPDLDRELHYDAVFTDAEQDAFMAARAWYALGNKALPPPEPEPFHDGTYNPDPLKYRIPKRPATIIFRQGPPRAQSYIADRLTKEGWFDSQDPWVVDSLLDEDRSWIPKFGSDGKRVSVTIPAWPGGSAQEAWQEAARRWQTHGVENGLRINPSRLLTYLSRAEEYCRRRPGLRVFEQTPPLTPEEAEDPHLQELYRAHRIMFSWAANRHMTNYETFEIEAEAMQSDDALLAKKKFRQADQAVREAAQYGEALRLYDEGFAAWLRLLNAHQSCRSQKGEAPSVAGQGCRDFRDLDRPQEEAYELNVKYIKLAQDVHRTKLRSATQWVNDLVFHIGAATTGNPFQFACDLSVLAAEVEVPGPAGQSARGVDMRVPQLRDVPPLPVPGPMDGLAPDGTPWVADTVKVRVKERLGLIKPQAPAQPAVPPGGRPATPPTGSPARP
jgi:hypothetical protein